MKHPSANESLDKKLAISTLAVKFANRIHVEAASGKQLTLFDIQEKKMSAPTNWFLYVDGASRNNPGPAGAGIYLLKNGEPCLKKGYFLGIMTNNQAEYTALLLGFFLLDQLFQEADRLSIFSDSLLLIKQLKGEYKIKQPHLKALCVRAKLFLQQKDYILNHIPREKNSVADRLANLGIDKKIQLPSDFEIFSLP